jgi:glycerol kinase
MADVVNHWALDRQFTPNMPTDRREALYCRWQDAVRRSLDSEERA